MICHPDDRLLRHSRRALRVADPELFAYPTGTPFTPITILIWAYIIVSLATSTARAEVPSRGASAER